MAQTTKYIWFNGELVEWDKAQVHVMTHALHYGSSVFEGIRAYDTPNGPAIFRLKEHIQRLFDSAKIYWMDMPYSKEAICEACREIVRANDLKSGYLRPLAFVGNVGLGLHPPKDAHTDVMIGALIQLDEAFDAREKILQSQQGADFFIQRKFVFDHVGRRV